MSHRLGSSVDGANDWFAPDPGGDGGINGAGTAALSPQLRAGAAPRVSEPGVKAFHVPVSTCSASTDHEDFFSLP
jgi:hypothetical protein